VASKVSLDVRLARPELVSHYLTGERKYPYLRSPTELKVGHFIQAFSPDDEPIVLLILEKASEPWFFGDLHYYLVKEL
jgi:hypothetical protein